MKRVLGILISMVLLAGVVSAQDSTPQPSRDDKLLAWVAPGTQPGQHSAVGQLAFVDAAGVITAVMDVAPQSSTVTACGGTPISPDGETYAFFMGGDAGALYLLSGDSAPVQIDSVERLSCLGRDALRYTGDSARMAYISYEADARTSEFADGFLHIYNLETSTQEASFENVTAFDMNDEQIAFISFFTNDRGEADEASFNIWENGSDREITAVVPDADCHFTSGQIGFGPGDSLTSALGQRCSSGDTRSQWQLYQINPEDRSAARVLADFQPGAFASFARTNNLFFTADGGVLFTVPNGVTAHTATLASADLDSGATSIILENAVWETYSGTAAAAPVISPDRRWLAITSGTADGDNSLHLVNLEDPSIPVVTVSAGSRGDVIADMDFTADSERLVYVAGADGGGDNALFVLNTADGVQQRVGRGRYVSVVVSPSGDSVIATEWQRVEDPNEPLYLNTVLVDLTSGESATLFEGAQIVDGKVTNPQFAQPLVWR